MDKNFYNFVKLKMKLIEKNLIKKDCLKEFSIDRLFETINLKKVNFTINKETQFVLDTNQIEEFFNYIKKEYNYDLTFFNKETIKINPETNVKSYYVANIEDVINARDNARQNPEYQELLKEKEIEKEEKLKKFKKMGELENLDLKEKDIGFVSFDFEFKPNVMNKFLFSNTFEVGITVLKNNKYESFHYIVKENSNQKEGDKRERQNSFHFGKSKTVSFVELKDIIQSFVNENNFLIVHEHSNDLSILKQNEINFNYDYVRDTQMVYAFNFNKDNEQPKSLKKHLDSNNIIYKDLHNAGNDARYTMMLFKTMVNDYKNIKNKTKLHIKN